MATTPDTYEHMGKGTSASKLCLSAGNRGICPLPGVTPESTIATEEILQENHDSHHIFFNSSGYHNHIVHHILALYSLGANPETLRSAYNHNKTYQRPRPKVNEEVLANLRDDKKWQDEMGKRDNYGTFLKYFAAEIEEHGIRATVNNTLFAGTPRSEDLLIRMFSGFVHPFIHLGYAIEFNLAPILAEALAQAAAHERWIGDYLIEAEKAAVNRDLGRESTHDDFVALRHAVRADEKLRTAAEWSDDNKLQGVIARALPNIVEIASRVRVRPDNLYEKVKESINLSAQICAGAIRKDKKIMFDFYLMHSHNSSIFLSPIAEADWISTEAKCRVVEWKVRYDLIAYAARRAPEIHLDEVENYVPMTKDDANPWMSIVERGLKVKDDGHTIKMLRAILHGEEVAQHQGPKDGMLTGKMWQNYGAMVIDSVWGLENEENFWIRSAGFDEAWKEIPPRN